MVCRPLPLLLEDRECKYRAHEGRGKNKKKINIYYAYRVRRERIGGKKERRARESVCVSAELQAKEEGRENNKTEERLTPRRSTRRARGISR